MSDDDLSSLSGFTDYSTDIDETSDLESFDEKTVINENIKKINEETEKSDLNSESSENSDIEDDNNDSDNESISNSDIDTPDIKINKKKEETKEENKVKINEKCLYKIINKDTLNKHTFNKHIEVVKKEDRITRPILTRYEYVAALSTRAKQISLNAKPMIKNAAELSKKLDPRQIAEIEIKETRTCPLYIVRPLPNFKEEHWDINELELIY